MECLKQALSCNGTPKRLFVPLPSACEIRTELVMYERMDKVIREINNPRSTYGCNLGSYRQGDLTNFKLFYLE